MNKNTKQLKRLRRHGKIRSTVIGTASKPRVSVFRSNRNILVQLIDDSAGKTLLGTKLNSGKTKLKGDKTTKATETGKMLAEKAKAAGIEQVVFDRGGYKYHGRVKALAEGLRAGGLKF